MNWGFGICLRSHRTGWFWPCTQRDQLSEQIRLLPVFDLLPFASAAAESSSQVQRRWPWPPPDTGWHRRAAAAAAAAAAAVASSTPSRAVYCTHASRSHRPACKSTANSPDLQLELHDPYAASDEQGRKRATLAPQISFLR
jgi:hypothetical protein